MKLSETKSMEMGLGQRNKKTRLERLSAPLEPLGNKTNRKTNTLKTLNSPPNNDLGQGSH